MISFSLEKASEQLKSGLERYLSPDRHHHENVGEQKQKKILTVLTKEPVIHADAEVTHFLTNQVRERLSIHDYYRCQI